MLFSRSSVLRHFVYGPENAMGRADASTLVATVVAPDLSDSTCVKIARWTSYVSALGKFWVLPQSMY
jgi:hypothetical protein